MSPKIPFQRLAPFGKDAVGKDATGIEAALRRVLASGRFVLGPEVEAFETAFAHFLGVAHAVGVGSGTAAITLALRAAGIGPGDRVLTPAFSTGYTALAVLHAGAVPVFADVERGSLCLSASAAERALEKDRVAAILPVHLFGHAGDGWEQLVHLAVRHDVPLIEDACQAHGARFRGQPLGSFGTAAAFSFYPTKNLAALGDAGLFATRDAELADRVRRLRFGGQRERHHHEDAGWNSRLDELQAAVLSERLPALADANAERQRLSHRYREALAGLSLDFVAPGNEVESACHLFVVRCPERDALQRHLTAAGIETLIHYPVSLPDQRAFAQFAPSASTADAFPEAARAAAEVLSLPLYPGLGDDGVEQVATTVRSFFGDRSLRNRAPAPVSE